VTLNIPFDILPCSFFCLCIVTQATSEGRETRETQKQDEEEREKEEGKTKEWKWWKEEEVGQKMDIFFT
jgi:hypothetical protein